jgi:hypothetical protein
MSKQAINIGTIANDGTGDPLRTAFNKTNLNFNEIYNALGDGTSVTNIVNNDGQIELTSVPNKISFIYANVASLPNATNYAGCIAYVLSTGSLYYAHLGSWRKLLSDTSAGAITNYTDNLSPIAFSGNLLDLNGGIADGTDGQVLTTDGNGNFAFSTVSGGGSGTGGNAFGTIVVSGQSDVLADAPFDTLTFVAGSGIDITTNAAADTITFAANTSGLATFSPTRNSQTVTTASLADGASGNIAFDQLGLSYALYSIQVDRACWVRIYSDTASRTADAGRTQGADPSEGAGVIAEIIATGATTFKITPAVYGYISTGESTIPVAVKNNSGSTSTVQVTITALTLEE